MSLLEEQIRIRPSYYRLFIVDIYLPTQVVNSGIYSKPCVHAQW